MLHAILDAVFVATRRFFVHLPVINFSHTRILQNEFLQRVAPYLTYLVSFFRNCFVRFLHDLHFKLVFIPTHFPF